MTNRTATPGTDALRARTAERIAVIDAEFAAKEAELAAAQSGLINRVAAEGRTANDEELAEFERLTKARSALKCAAKDARNNAKPSATEWNRARAVDRGRDPERACGRCAGTGEYRGFGTCFDCGGTGEVD